MEKGQIWTAEGLPVNCDTVKALIKDYKDNGIKSADSGRYLTAFVEQMDDDMLLEMYSMDADTAAEIFVECFGARAAFKKINKAAGIMPASRISPAVYEETAAKYEECIKKANEEKDKILSDYTYAAQKAEDAEERIRELEEMLAHYKADLYDFYAQAGKLPSYERR